MVTITLDNVEGLFTGPLAQLSANLQFASNDNFSSCGAMQEALDIMDHILSQDSPLKKLCSETDDVDDIVRRIESRMQEYEKALMDIEKLIQTKPHTS